MNKTSNLSRRQLLQMGGAMMALGTLAGCVAPTAAPAGEAGTGAAAEGADLRVLSG